MTKNLPTILYVLLLIVVIVSVDFAFLRNLLWLRLIVNIGIVLVFVVVYLAFLKKP